jgi:hypothetical protein
MDELTSAPDNSRPFARFRPGRQWMFLLGCLLIGGILRFYDLNWDQGHFFHPDERNIANAVAKIHFFDQLNPQFFAYGGLTIYLFRAAGELLVKMTGDARWVSDWAAINLIGRWFAALFSTLTVLPIFFLARRLFNVRVAALAALLFVFCVGSIQIAHFAITESFITLCIVTLCWLALRLAERPTIARYGTLAIVQGIALAAKTSAISFYVLPLLAHAVVLYRERGRRGQHAPRWSDFNWLALMAVALSLVVFFFGSPYTLLDWTDFRASMTYENGVVQGTIPVPYTRQFVGTTPYWFQLKNLFWQLGPVALFCYLGILLLLARAVRRRDWRAGLLLAFPLLYFLYVGDWHTKFIRYMMPAVPFLLIAGAYCLWWIGEKAAAARRAVLGKAVAGTLVVVTALWALAFFSIYFQEPTRLAASRWIYRNVPAGSKIFGEHWDDGLPVPVPDVETRPYDVEQLEIYNEDNAAKLEYYADRLSRGDYIVLNSRRLYGTLMHLPEEYPLTSLYYKLLFSGRLGYEKVAQFTAYPKLLGFIPINDDASEETFQVYEHPKVIIFQNRQHLSREAIRSILQEALQSAHRQLKPS